MTLTNLAVWVPALVVGLLTGHACVNAILLRRPVATPSTVGFPVSVLLPVRDEAHRVRGCVESLLAQRGVPSLEIVVLDDGSSDGTAEVVRAAARDDPRLRLVAGEPLPPGWLGKAYACHQLATHAAPRSRVFVFIDADVVLAADAVAAAVGLLDGLDLVSPYPRIVTAGVGERLVQPLLQWSWLSFLPLRALERSARPSLAAAGGQLLVVTRVGYERAGGHAAVRANVLEDIALARSIKRTGGRIALADGSRIASCRMYGSWRELVAGYSKSLWAAFGSPVGAAAVVVTLSILYVAAPVFAAVAAALGEWTWAAAGAASFILAVVGRVVAGLATGTRVWPDALAHPVSIAVFGWLVAHSYRQRRHRQLIWKGRAVT